MPITEQEMLDVINSTLEKKPLTTEGGIQRNNDGTEGMEKAAKSNGKSTNMPIDATTPIEEQPQTQVNDAANAVKSVRIAGTTHMKEAGIQSSIEQTPHVQQNAAPTVNASAASQAQICDASITDYTAVPAAVNVSQPSKNGHKNIGANSTRLTRGASNENQNRDKAEKVVKGGGAEATITDYYAINKKGGSGGADGKKKEPHGKS